MTTFTTAPLVRHESAAGVCSASVTVVIVTYNSGSHIGTLLADLRAQRGLSNLRIIAVDNSSTDDTVAILRSAPGVRVLESGGNLGYAGAINLALRQLGDTEALLIVNPDLRLGPETTTRLLDRLRQPGVGGVVPRMLTAEGATALSLRFEPTLSRAWGDALLGGHLRSRPRWTTEMDWDPDSYDVAHPVEWATGACLLVRADVARELGDWDEQYFLYFEEVDYLRRLREAGHEVWYEPSAVVQHEGGGSGTSHLLEALAAVNRVRYAARRGRVQAELMRLATIVWMLARLHRPGERTALRFLLARRSWAGLPAAVRDPARPTTGSVIVPAHNEASVIARTLAPLRSVIDSGLEVVVAANGCDDATVEIARTLPGGTVLDLPTPSKVAALNAADAVATTWPRIYLDADVEITPRAIADVFAALGTGEVLAARPEFAYDTTGASWPVRAYYRARRRLPETTSRHLWGAGVYALSEAGHRRLRSFPDLLADDLYVDGLFADEEKRIVATDPVRVRTPRDLRSLCAILRRTYRGNAETLTEATVAGRPGPATTRRTAFELLRSATTPRRLVDAMVYATLVMWARRSAGDAAPRWERDASGRGEVAP